MLEEILRLIQPHITRGLEGDEFVPEYLLDAAGDLVDIISSDHASMSCSSPDDVSQRRLTVERAVQLIDRVMIVIFQASIRHS